jgi:uncharacterized protein (TIGR03083 family)
VTLSEIPKDRTVDALGSVWSSLSALLGSLSDEQWAQPTSLPGWDVKAIVAHMIGTEAMMLGETAPDVEIDRDAATHVRNDIGAFNEVWVQALADEPPEAVLTRFDDYTGRRLVALREMPQAEWDAESFTPAGRDTYGRFMQIRVFDCWFHEQDIREAVGRPGHVAGQAVAVTLDEVATALGFVVGKRAGVPQGCSVTFELTGSSGRSIHVEVGERARVAERLEGPASVTITMPVLTFTRLCGGRVPVESVRHEISVGGDAELAEKILPNLTYTI